MSKLHFPDKKNMFHAVLGGGLCFLVMFLLLDLARAGLERLIGILGWMSVMAFQDSFAITRSLFMCGLVYLPGGYCGGLYTGYVAEEDLNSLLVLSGLVSYSAFIILLYLLGNLTSPSVNYLGDVFLPLVGSMVGMFLGGYTMNWPTEEEDLETVEKLTLEPGK